MTQGFGFAVIDEPPFCFPTNGGAPGGYDVEVGLAVLRAIGINAIVLQTVTFAELLPGVAAGRWRINTPLFVTPERERQVLFSRGAWALSDGLLVRFAEAPRLTRYEDLAADPRLRLVVVEGQVQEQSALKAGVSPGQILRVPSPEAAVEAVRSGGAAAYASVAWAHRGFLQRTPDAALAVVELGAAEASRAIGAYSFGRGDDALRDAFDRALSTFHGSAHHRVIMGRYGFTKADMID